MSAGTTTWPFWCDGAQLFADRSPKGGWVETLVSTGACILTVNHDDLVLHGCESFGLAVLALSPVVIARRACVSDKKALT
jgi:hypothetical protein